MHLKICLLFGQIWSEDNFDSGQIGLQFSEFSSKGEKRVLVDEKLPLTKQERQRKQATRKPGFLLPNQRGENRHYNQDRRIKVRKRSILFELLNWNDFQLKVPGKSKTVSSPRDAQRNQRKNQWKKLPVDEILPPLRHRPFSSHLAMMKLGCPSKY